MVTQWMRNGFATGLENPRTTTIGLGLAVSSYLTSVGVRLPQNQDEWVAFAIFVAWSIFSWLARDVTPAFK